MTGGRCGGQEYLPYKDCHFEFLTVGRRHTLRWLCCFQAKTFAKPYFVLFIILTLNEVKGKNLYKTKNKILHFSAKSSE